MHALSIFYSFLLSAEGKMFLSFFLTGKMTADSDKDCTHCLICNSKVGVSTRNSVRIFGDSTVGVSEKPVVDVITSTLEVDINEESAHSLIICKKCYKQLNEVKCSVNKSLVIVVL